MKHKLILSISFVLSVSLSHATDNVTLPFGASYCMWQDEFSMMWIGTNDGLIRYDGVKTDYFRTIEEESSGLYNSHIREVCGDMDGNIFVLCKLALCRYDLRSESFHTIRNRGMHSICCHDGTTWVASKDSVFRIGAGDILEPEIDLGGKGLIINSILFSGDNYLYIGTDSGLWLADMSGKCSELMAGINILHLYQDSRQNIWACTKNSGIWIRSRNGEWASLRKGGQGSGLSSDYVRCVCEDSSGNYWIGTLEGLDIYNPLTRRISKDSKHLGIDRATIYSIFRDKQGTMWISAGGDVHRYNPDKDVFTNHDRFFKDSGANVVLDYAEAGGRFFFATSDRGIFVYDPKKGTSRDFPAKNRLSSPYVSAILTDSGGQYLWAGTRFGGLNRIDLASGDVKVFMAEETIFRLGRYKSWIIAGTSRGVMVFNTRSGEASELSVSEFFRKELTKDLLVDSSGNCWISTTQGLLCHNLDTGKEKEYFTKDKGLLGTNWVEDSFEDSRGRIWFGTCGSGLLQYKPESDSFLSYTTNNSHLASNYITAIAESQSGYLLVTCRSGFAKVDAERGIVHSYPSGIGFPQMPFTTRGLFVNSSGIIWASGFRKLLSFREDGLSVHKCPENLYFTSLEEGNVPIHTGDDSGILQQSLLFQDKITIKGGRTGFSVRTSAPDFLYQNGFEYKLEGFNNEWIRGTVGDRISYTSLKPGRYILKAHILDPESEGPGASRSLTINVRPAWYWSFPARAAYILLILTTILLFFNMYKNRIRFRTEIAEEKREKERIREANNSKLEFFSFLSHEIRTPVTLIQGQVESLLSNNELPPLAYNRILGVDRNLKKINSLLGELKDYRQHEGNGALPLKISPQNLVSQLERVTAVFRDYASSHNIKLRFKNRSKADLILRYDPDQMDKVFYNLVSNALKNTPPGGSVTIETEDGDAFAQVIVSDTGCGIPARYIESIFQPFFQIPGSPSIDQGTGLGLAITKRIVEAHGGKIDCHSTERVGTTFSVLIPKVQSPQEGEGIPSTEAATQRDGLDPIDEKTISRGRKYTRDIKPSILIVEDDEELREYLRSLFSPIYSVTTAGNGKEALDMMSTDIPDLVLSDLMMPGMDGNELCKRIKNNVYTSHVPVVILTARVAEESVLESLRNKADDYIAKPFNSKILIARCNNLINSRMDLQQEFAGFRSTASTLATNETDKSFIEKAERIINENLADTEYDVNRFAADIAMSRSKLFRKVKGLTGQTPGWFIRSIRLKAAKEMLSANEDYSVSEVSYQTGFSSPNYFIKAFKAAFGVTPASFKDMKRANKR